MLRCRLCQEGPQLDFGFGTVDLPAIHRAGSRDDQPLGLRGWTTIKTSFQDGYANLYNFRGCEIWNPLLFMQGCESALRSSRAHWKAHLWTQVLIGVSHLWGIQKSDWNHRNETELFSNYYKNILKFVNILSSFLTKSDLQMTSLGKRPWCWQVALVLLSSMESWHLRCTPLSSWHECGSNRNEGRAVACDSKPRATYGLVDQQLKNSVEIIAMSHSNKMHGPTVDLTDFVLESEHLKILSQRCQNLRLRICNDGLAPHCNSRVSGSLGGFQCEGKSCHKYPQTKHRWLDDIYFLFLNWYVLLVGKSYFLLFYYLYAFLISAAYSMSPLNAFRQCSQPDFKRWFPGFTGFSLGSSAAFLGHLWAPRMVKKGLCVGVNYPNQDLMKADLCGIKVSESRSCMFRYRKQMLSPCHN